ncbi:hypothetical protein P7L78_17815 [Tistrella bauzanensis]|uniref:Flagellum-specific ATP synthase FliI n=1 Tax=Tistrella arctica TaxID=3133430 RepID=A0ABU9YDL6_9PROT
MPNASNSLQQFAKRALKAQPVGERAIVAEVTEVAQEVKDVRGDLLRVLCNRLVGMEEIGVTLIGDSG